MTLTSEPDRHDAARRRRSGRWIDDWRPEDAEFWEASGRAVARRNLVWSIFAEHLGFSVWLIWSVSSAFLLAQGFDVHAAAAVPAGGAAQPGRVAAAAALHVRGAEVRRPQLDDGQRRAAADPDAAVRVRRAATRARRTGCSA